MLCVFYTDKRVNILDNFSLEYLKVTDLLQFVRLLKAKIPVLRLTLWTYSNLEREREREGGGGGVKGEVGVRTAFSRDFSIISSLHRVDIQ